MIECVEQHRARKRKLEGIRHLTRLSLVVEMTTKIRNEKEQKAVYVNDVKFHCNE